MKSIIKEIFYGERGHAELIKLSGRYFEAVGRLSEVFEALKGVLPEEKLPLLREYCDLHGETELLSAEEHFTEGLKIGLLLGIEAGN